jgi:hypothetical protein
MSLDLVIVSRAAHATKKPGFQPLQFFGIHGKTTRKNLFRPGLGFAQPGAPPSPHGPGSSSGLSADAANPSSPAFFDDLNIRITRLGKELAMLVRVEERHAGS